MALCCPSPAFTRGSRRYLRIAARAIVVVALILIVGFLWQAKEPLLSYSSPSAQPELYSAPLPPPPPPPHLVVVMPFVFSQTDKLLRNLQRWNSITPPCNQANMNNNSTLPTTSLYFLADSDNGNPDSLTTFLETLKQTAPCTAWCFKEVKVISAGLQGASNQYDSKRLSASWAAGPSNQFYFNFQYEEFVNNYDYLFLMEPDSWPIAPYWLTSLESLIASLPKFWVLGSVYRGACVISKGTLDPGVKIVTPEDIPPGLCTPLGEDIASHLNGNAVYAVGDADFRTFLQDVRSSKFKDWPFDLAMYRHISDPEKEDIMRPLLTKYVPHDFLMNYGTYPFDLQRLQEESPGTLFIHTDEIEPPKEEEAPVVESNPDMPPELLAAVKDVSSVRKDVFVTFALGDNPAFARNWIANMRRSQLSNFVLISFDSVITFALTEGGYERNVVDLSSLAVPAFVQKPNSKVDPLAQKLASAKLMLIPAILRAGYNVIYSDVSIPWIRDPSAHFSGDYDLEILSNSRYGFAESEPGFSFKEFISSSVYFARASPAAIRFHESVKALLAPGSISMENIAYNVVLQNNSIKMRYRVLEPSLFPNFAVRFGSFLPQRMNTLPLMVQPSLTSSVEARIYHLRIADAWLVEDPAYDPSTESKYLVIKSSEVQRGYGDVRSILESALAIAHILNRILVLPPIHLYGNIESETSMDVLFDYDALVKTFPNIRDHRFAVRNQLNDPYLLFHIDVGLLDESVEDESLEVKSIKAEGTKGANDAEIIDLFHEHENNQVVVLNRALGRFGGFVNAVADKAFHQRLNQGLVPSKELVRVGDQTLKKIPDFAKEQGWENFDGFSCVYLKNSTFQNSASVFDIAQKTRDALVTNGFPDFVYFASPSFDIYPSEFLDAMQSEGVKILSLNDILPGWARFMRRQSELDDQRIGVLEQKICSAAKSFAGTESTWFSGSVCDARVKSKATPCVLLST